DFQMAGEAALAGDGDVIAKLGRASDANLGDEQAMFADLHVVPDLDQIIDLGPLTNHSFAERGAVDCGASADLDVIFDSDNADLRDLVMLAAVRGKTIAIGPDHDTAMDNAAVADAGAVIDDDVGINDAVLANHRAGFDGDILENRHVVPDDDVLADDRERA